MIKIEKIKRKYEEYELSFTTQAHGLPEQVPMPLDKRRKQLALDSVDEEEVVANQQQEAKKGVTRFTLGDGSNNDDSFFSAASFNDSS